MFIREPRRVARVPAEGERGGLRRHSSAAGAAGIRRVGATASPAAGRRRRDGTYEVKVRWTSAGYRGPVLIRAGRIDGPGTALSAFSCTGEDRDGGHYAVIEYDPGDLPGTTTVSGPGCYAIQADGTSFSTTIVFLASA